MRDQLQEEEAEEEASVVDSEVDFPAAAVASVVAFAGESGGSGERLNRSVGTNEHSCERSVDRILILQPLRRVR